MAGVASDGLRLLLGEGDGHEVHLTSNPWAISTNDSELEGAWDSLKKRKTCTVLRHGSWSLMGNGALAVRVACCWVDCT